MRAAAIDVFRIRFGGLSDAIVGTLDDQIEWYQARIGDLRVYMIDRGRLLAPLREPAAVAADTADAEAEIVAFTDEIAALDEAAARQCERLIERFEERILDLRVCRSNILRASKPMTSTPAASTAEEDADIARIAKQFAPAVAA
ncbi:MAG: hypothetical protein WDM94_09420 [Bauldia sp.]